MANVQAAKATKKPRRVFPGEEQILEGVRRMLMDHPRAALDYLMDGIELYAEAHGINVPWEA